MSTPWQASGLNSLMSMFINLWELIVMLSKEMFEKTRSWMYRNARPLDLARWQYHFEGGSQDRVLEALSAYQNADGGFAHALEPDSWNPNSSPIQTWAATEILREISFTDRDHPIIKGILLYLGSGADFDGQVWNCVVETNNEYPHAPWWHADKNGSQHDKYNPTACLAGFVLYFSDPDSDIHRKCKTIAAVLAESYVNGDMLDDMHAVSCLIRLMEYSYDSGITSLFYSHILRHKLIKQVRALITTDTDLWKTSYVCKPSQFINSRDSIFYPDNKDIAEQEADFIISSISPEGIWDVTWSWSDYPDAWAISRNWWKGHIAVNNMLYLKNFGRLADIV